MACFHLFSRQIPMTRELTQTAKSFNQGFWGGCSVASACTYTQLYFHNKNQLSYDFYYTSFLRDNFLEHLEKRDIYIHQNLFTDRPTLIQESSEPKEFFSLFQKYPFVYYNDFKVKKSTFHTLWGVKLFKKKFDRLIKAYNTEWSLLALDFFQSIQQEKILSYTLTEIQDELAHTKHWEYAVEALYEQLNFFDYLNSSNPNPEHTKQFNLYTQKLDNLISEFKEKTYLLFDKSLNLPKTPPLTEEDQNLSQYRMVSIDFYENKELIIQTLIEKINNNLPLLFAYEVPYKLNHSRYLLNYNQVFEEDDTGPHQVVLIGYKLNEKNELEYVKIKNSYGPSVGKSGEQVMSAEFFFKQGIDLSFLEQF